MNLQKRSFLNAYGLILGFAILKLVIHLLTNHNYGFHRDELLHLALANHPAWGFLEVPPSIAIFGWLGQALFGDSLVAVRFIPAIIGACTIFLTGLMAKEMGGKWFAQLLACFAFLFSIAYLRTNLLFQPVCFDIFYWTLFAWLIIKYINTKNEKFIIWLGIAIGLGMMNKYSVAFMVLAIVAAFLLRPERNVFSKKKTWIAFLIAFLIFLPNLIWQYQHNFPIVHHMKELRETQLVHVSIKNFLVDQLFMNLPGLIIWIAGLIVLFVDPQLKKYRIIGYTFLLVILLLAVLSGKSYYTLGAYPMVIAAGGVAWERLLSSGWKVWLRPALLLMPPLLLYPMLPIAVPYLPIDKLITYCKELTDKIGTDAHIRWEDGKVHDIPQDFADMYGWEELAQNAAKAYYSLPAEEQANTFIFCENYGFAGAIDHFGKKYKLPPAISFNASYLLWFPKFGKITTLIYIDNIDESTEAFNLFGSVKKIGEITNKYAREKGTGVYLLQNPIKGIDQIVQQKINEEKKPFVR